MSVYWRAGLAVEGACELDNLLQVRTWAGWLQMSRRWDFLSFNNTIIAKMDRPRPLSLPTSKVSTRKTSQTNYNLNKIDNSYRKARDDLDRSYDSEEMSDGLAKNLWSIWNETGSYFEDLDEYPDEDPEDM